MNPLFSASHEGQSGGKQLNDRMTLQDLAMLAAPESRTISGRFYPTRF